MGLPFKDMTAQMDEWQREAERKANESSQQWQRELAWNDCFVTYEPHVRTVAFCRVLKPEEIWPYQVRGGAANEIEQERDSLRSRMSRGYRYCYVFTDGVPAGIRQDVHVAKAILKISLEDMQKASASGWNLEQLRKIAPDVAVRIDAARSQVRIPTQAIEPEPVPTPTEEGNDIFKEMWG